MKEDYRNVEMAINNLETLFPDDNEMFVII